MAQLARTLADRPLPAQPDVGDVATDRRGIRPAGVQIEDALNLPAADQALCQLAGVSHKRFALSERQFITSAESEVLGHVNVGNIFFVEPVASQDGLLISLQATRESEGTQEPETRRVVPAQGGLQGMIDAGSILAIEIDGTEDLVRPARLDDAGAGGRVVNADVRVQGGRLVAVLC